VKLRVLLLCAVVALAATACSSSKHAAATRTVGAPVKSPIVVSTPIQNSQWRSPISIKGTTSLPGELTFEVLGSSGKQLGSKTAAASDGRFSVAVPFKVGKLTSGAVLVRDEHSDHLVQVAVVLTP